MKPGGLWNLRGLRPRAQGDARDAARQSGASVGEWLNSVIESDDDDDVVDGRPRRRHRREPVAFGAPQRREAGPHRDPHESDRYEPRRDAEDEDDRERLPRRDRYRDARDSAPRREEFDHVNDRLDKLSQQLERIVHAAAVRQETPAASNAPSEPLAPPLNGAPAPPVPIAAVPQEVPAPVNVSSQPHQPPLNAAPPPRRRANAEAVLSIDDAVAEITARQRALDGDRTVADAATAAPAASESAPVLDFSSLEKQLREITARIEALQPSSDVGNAITALRGDLAEIGRQLNEALPRRAVESLEREIKALAERIDNSRQAGVDPNALAGLERGLAEVREALRGLTPAESLVGFNEAVNALAQKVDMILARDDPATLQQLEAAIGGLRGVASHVASNDTLTRVAEDVRTLTAQVDGIANNAATGHAVAALEQRIDTLAAALHASNEARQALPHDAMSRVASNDALARVAEDVRALAAQVDGLANNAATGRAVAALEQRIDTLAGALHASSEAGQAVPRDLEKLLGGLIEKLEWVQLTHTDHAALAHLEDRIAMLVKRFDTSDARLNQLEAVERGLADLLIHIEQMRDLDGDAAPAARLAPALAPTDLLEPDAAEIKQSERRTRDSLAATQDAAERVVDPMAAIESNLYDTAPPATPAAETQTFLEATREPRAAVPGEISPAAAEAVPVAVEAAAAIAPAAPHLRAAAAAAPVARAPIDPTLPPDHPLEPGSTGTRARPNASAAERVAASQAAIGSAKPPVIADSGRPNFIAAARRAAQAAAWEPSSAKAKGEPSAADRAAEPSKLSQRLRKLVMAGSALLIVVGGLRIAIRLFDDHRMIGGPVPVQSEQVAAPAAPTPAPIAQQSSPANGPAAAALPPPLPHPNAVAAPRPEPAPAKAVKPPHESLLQDDERATVAAAAKPAGGQPAASALPLWASPDITGTLPRALAAPDNIQQAPAAAAAAAVTDDNLPASIGDPALRAAALGGDPAAAYEVAARFAEGRGVPQNHAEAAHWLERAAEQGLAPAQFRLGGLYEKGIGVKKDLIRARNLYLAAAEKGNGKAMHNLAVLYAEGIEGAPDYKNAAEWFGKAAERGLRDSQYNLGILYARGIGVTQNYAASYKWFALAAKQGDHDAASKRDDVAFHLDAPSLAAARLAVQNFKPAPQPDDAINVATAAAWQSAAKPPQPANAK